MTTITHNLRSLLLTALCTLFAFGSAQAQSMQIPTDPNVRIGTLENGLTYYIRHNKQPAERADFYIAQKVGSIQEDSTQLGLAHFLEHMAFNGTTHFPGDSLKQYLETIGVKFGENLNAYTSVDETVYNISNVPVVREGIVDSCLLILHDWSNDLLLEPKEIDKERGVITEEWRTRMNASQRYIENLLPEFFKGTKYENCLPIGDMDIVNNFEYQTLRDYYEKWYRPDLQGIIVVGDVDVDVIENKIKELFADVDAPVNPAERIYYPVNDNDEPLVFIHEDKEQPNIMLSYFNKYDAIPAEAKENLGYLQLRYGINMISSMLNNRLNEIAEQANPPFIYAGTYDADFIVAKTKRAFTGAVVCKEDNIKGGIETLYEELERVSRFGFTESEYIRARASYISALESAFNERDKNKNNDYVNQYVRHFLDNEPMPGIEYEHTMMSAMAEQITVEMINQLVPMLISEKNKAITLSAPKKEGLTLPTNEELTNWLIATSSKELTPYEEELSDEPLLSKEPEGGKIVKTQTDELFGSTLVTLSNGIKVYIKPTELKADQILYKGFSMGGDSQFDDSEAINIKQLNSVALVGGLGSFSTVDLGKVLAGKRASVTPSVNYLNEGVDGFCVPRDFETLMQLIYLTFTEPRKDQEAFESYINRTRAAMINQELNPMMAFSDSLTSSIYNNHPRTGRVKIDELEKIDYDRILEMYHDRFKDASDFTFIFVGNIDMDKNLPLIEKYLGGLPSINRKESFIDRKLNARKGQYQNKFIKQQDNPKATIFSFISGDTKYTQENKTLMSMLSQILTLVYTEKVREDEGGTYGVGVSGAVSKFPKPEASLYITFDTDPAKKEHLMKIIYNELDHIAKVGPSAENLAKVKENMIKKLSENKNENGYWLGAIYEKLYSNTDIVTNYEETVKSITADDIKKFANKLFKQNNKIEVVMVSPEK